MSEKLLYDENYDYVSWISNVSGRLFFRLTDGYNYRYDRIVGDVVHYNGEIDNNRVFFLSLLADLRDLREDTSSKYTRVVIFATAKPTNCHGKFLYGNVYLIDDNSHNSLRKDSYEIDFLQSINSAIKSNIVTEEFFKEKINKLINQIDNKEIRNVSFKLQNTGIIHLKKNHAIPNHSDIVDADVQASFYLLKFTFHKDRHHKNSEESIIPMIAQNSMDECNIDNIDLSKNYTIAHHLIEGVKQYIAEKRKLSDDSSRMFFNLKGVLNYTQTMTEILIEYMKMEKSREIIKYEQRCLENLNSSIERELEKKPYRPATFYEFLPELRNILFIPLLILSAFYAISRIDEGLKNTLALHISQIEQYYIFTIIIAISIMESIRKWYYRDDTFFIDFVINIPSTFLRFIKKYSNPNLYPKWRFIGYYIVPSIINMEMTIRRSLSIVKILFYIFFILSYIAITTTIYYIYF